MAELPTKRELRGVFRGSQKDYPTDAVVLRLKMNAKSARENLERKRRERIFLSGGRRGQDGWSFIIVCSFGVVQEILVGGKL